MVCILQGTPTALLQKKTFSLSFPLNPVDLLLECAGNVPVKNLMPSVLKFVGLNPMTLHAK